MLTLVVLIATVTLGTVMTGHMVAAACRSRYVASAAALALFFGVITLSSSLLVVYLSAPMTALVRARAVLGLIALPAVYLHFLAATSPSYAWAPRHLLYFVPAFAGVLALSMDGAWLLDPLVLLTYLACILGLLIIQLRANEHFADLGERRGPTVLWLRIVIAVLIAMVVLEGVIFQQMLHGGILQTSAPLILSFAMLVAMIAFAMIGALGRPSLFEHIHDAALSSTTYRQPVPVPNPDPADTALCNEAMALLGDANILADEALTLTRLARRMGVPARSLSNAVNRELGKSFSEVLNDKRVQLCEAFMRHDSERGLLDIMYAAGYGSKSNFYKQFMRRTGQAPAAYRMSLAARGVNATRKPD